MVSRFWKKVRGDTARTCRVVYFWAGSMARSLWRFSAGPGALEYAASAVGVALLWCVASTRAWPDAGRDRLLAVVGASIPSGTVVTVAFGLAAIPLALLIMLGKTYSGEAGRLRVFLRVSQVQLALIAAATTGVVSAAVGGEFRRWLALIYLPLLALLSCSSVLRVLGLLLHPGQFFEQWARFILSRQQRITSRSAFRQRRAVAAAAVFGQWGEDIKIDGWFEHFHREDLSRYARIAAGRIGQVDDLDQEAVRQQLTALQTYAHAQTSQCVPAPEDASATTDSSSIGKHEDHDSLPLLVITHLPGSLVDDPDEAVSLFRKDVLPNPRVCRSIERSLRRAFRVDNSERVLEMIADLRSEAVELRDELMRGIRSNNYAMITDFRYVSEHVIGAARSVMEEQPSTAATNVYSDVLDVLVHSVNDARHLVEKSSESCDEEVKNLVLSLPRRIAYAGAEAGSPNAFRRCLSLLFGQCREALEQQPIAPEAEDCLSWYGVLSSAIQRMTDPNGRTQMSTDNALSEAKLLLQDLSGLLLISARARNWDAAALVVKEIPSLEPQRSGTYNPALTSAEYTTGFAALMRVLYFGAHACLVDLAEADASIPVPPSLIQATWPHDDSDLSTILSVYARAVVEGSADGSDWGWEPPMPPHKAYFIRTNEVLACGFVAAALTLPEWTLFRDLSDWLVAQKRKLEEAAGGVSELEQLLGKDSPVDKVLKDDTKLTRLAQLVQRSHGSSSALNKLLKYVQDAFEAGEHARIRGALVPQDVIRDFATRLAEQYNAKEDEAVTVLETYGLLSTGPAPSDLPEVPRSLGINTVIDKQWFITSSSDSWSHMAKEYGNALRQMQVGFTISRLTKIGIATELASLSSADSPIQASTCVLLVDTDVESLPSELQARVETAQSPRSEHGAPDAFLSVAGQRLPVYRMWVAGAKPVILFVDESHSARAIRVPWDSEAGWIPSARNEVKVRLRNPSHDSDAMDILLAQDSDWLQEKADTREGKEAYLQELVWLQAFERLAFDAGATPGILRLDLPADEPDAPT